MGKEHCEAIIGQRADEYGFRAVVCHQVIGVRSFTSVSGLRVTYCSIEGHQYNVRRRFVEGRPVLADPEWPGDLPRDPIDEYKSWTDAGWTEAEARMLWGDR